jgi:hypothetical protein
MLVANVDESDVEVTVLKTTTVGVLPGEAGKVVVASIISISISGWRQKEKSDPDPCQRHETFPKPGFLYQMRLVRCKRRVNSL